VAISDRQAAAIRRRKQGVEADRRMAEERARLALVMPAEAEQPQDPDLVGWAYLGKYAGGEGHQCINCHPTKPGLVFDPVQRFRLAARRPCGTCGAVLETIVRAVEEK
jgi:hypothetical protein